MYERRNQPPISPSQFRLRMLRHLGWALALLAVSLLIGTAGQVYLEGFGWQKAFLSSCVLLAGLGLAVLPESEAGQLFVSFYALYAGFIFLVTSSILIAPLLHRLLHHFHWTDRE